MSYPNLQVQKPYEHLVEHLDHVVLYGSISQVRVGDLLLDGMFAAKSIAAGIHDGQPSVAIQLSPIEAPGVSVGRLVLADFTEVTFARLIGVDEFTTWDPQTTDTVADANYDEVTETLTSDLMPGLYVGWIDGDPEAPHNTCVRRVENVYSNGLIQFEDGAYQSSPSASWYVLNCDPRDDDFVLTQVKKSVADDAAFSERVPGAPGLQRSRQDTLRWVQWQNLRDGNEVRFETIKVRAVREFLGTLPATLTADQRDVALSAWCNEHSQLPYYVDRVIQGVQDITDSPGIVRVDFMDDLGHHVATLTDYMTTTRTVDSEDS